jgi:hypothetical protein
MTCPPEIEQTLLEILRIGILRIRGAAWAGDISRCAIEADHIHNLPQLLENYAPDLLKYYWETERTAFIDQSSEAALASFEPLWSRLSSHALDSTDQVLAK